MNSILRTYVHFIYNTTGLVWPVEEHSDARTFAMSIDVAGLV